MTASPRLPIAQAIDLVTTALMNNAVSATNARSVAKALVAAEVDGQSGHGFARVAAYAAQAKSGKVDGAATPKIMPAGSAMVSVDAAGGFAYPALDAAITALADLAPQTGIAAAAITRSHHCGQLGAHVEKLAEKGLVAMMVANSPQAMAPWGGHTPVFGTNPIAFAAPRAEGAPLVIDLSLSKVARGKVMAAKKQGRSIPEGWALDANGQPTTDPDAALAGMMLPMADAKGAALALVVEILAASVTGANYSFQAASFFDAAGANPGVGHFLLAIDPGQNAQAHYGARIETLLSAIQTQDGARLPGSSRHAARAQAAAHGVTVPAHLLAEIKEAIGTEQATE